MKTFTVKAPHINQDYMVEVRDSGRVIMFSPKTGITFSLANLVTDIERVWEIAPNMSAFATAPLVALYTKMFKTMTAEQIMYYLPAYDIVEVK